MTEGVKLKTGGAAGVADCKRGKEAPPKHSPPLSLPSYTREAWVNVTVREDLYSSRIFMGWDNLYWPWWFFPFGCPAFVLKFESSRETIVEMRTKE